MVSVNGVNTAMGRWPNSGYLTYESYSGNSSITSSSLSGSSNWVGAGIVIKKLRYALERGTVVSQSGNTIGYQDPGLYTPSNNFGFFITNDPRTLDVQNEWYYNPSTKKLRIFSYQYPANIEVASKENLFSTPGNKSYLTISDLCFRGSNSTSLNLNSSNNITVQNCDILFSGIDGITTQGISTTIDNNVVRYANDIGIKLGGSSSNSEVTNNILTGIGIIPGMTQTYSYGSISSFGDNSLVQYNSIDSSGYIGIDFNGNYSKIKNNFINHSCLIKDDGAGIYTAGTNAGREITGNVILNSIGNSEGTDVKTNVLAHGIHLDGGTRFVTVANNSVSGCRGSGIFIQQSTDITITGNTSYDNGVKLSWLKGQIMFQYTSDNPIRRISLNNNIFFAKSLDQVALFYYTNSTNTGDIKQLGSADYNYYVRPLDENNSICEQTGTLGEVLQSLTNWQSFIGQDYNSNASPKSITDVNDLRFEYNASQSNKTVSLDANYIDVTGKSYNGSITLAPYSSAVLIKNGPATSSQPPTANAGKDTAVLLPNTTTNLSGVGNVGQGAASITGYVWSQVSGSSAGITSPSSATTSITGLSEGSYQFQLKVTDNNGVSATDTVQIVVKASKDLLPSVNPANMVNGLNFQYYEQTDYSALPDFSKNNPVKTGNTSNFDLSVANRNSQYAINFTGYINIPTDGQYTFYTSSDDGSSLFIDGVKVVDNDGLHSEQERSGVIGLQAGKHAISVGFFQGQGLNTLKVSYAGGGLSKQQVPASELYRTSDGPGSNLLPAVNPSNLVNGIDYKYYEQASYTVLPDFSQSNPVKTGNTSNFDLSVANRNSQYAINFTGYINIPTDGKYTFYTSSDDGSNLFIDGVKVLNNDGLHSEQERSGVIGLQAGKHAISVGFFQGQGLNTLKVSYAGEGLSKQQVPASELYRTSDGLGSNLVPAVNPLNLVNGIDYKYYEQDNYNAIPDFSRSNVIKAGTTNNFDVSIANRLWQFAVNFTGYINVPADGQYTFYTSSDDGSNLFIDGIKIVDNDRQHSQQERSGKIGLQAGKHLISVGFFQAEGDQILKVGYTDPNGVKNPISASDLFRIATQYRTGDLTLGAETAKTGNTNSISQLTPSNEISDTKVNLEAFPNPFINTVQVNILGKPGKYDLLLVDAIGRVLWKKSINKAEGLWQENINTTSLHKGVYFLRVVKDNLQSSIIKLEK
jgi:hypothetical protein